MNEKRMKISAAELVEDYDIYPRTSVISAHVTQIADAMLCGREIPPILIDMKSKRIIDGYHRRRAAVRAFGDTVKIKCIMREYPDKNAMYKDAIEENARHGEGLKGECRTHALLLGKGMGIPSESLAGWFGISVEKVEMIVAIKAGNVKPFTAKGKDITRKIPLKNSVRHLWGTNPTFTPAQEVAHKSGPGQSQLLLIRQLSDYIETGLIDSTNIEIKNGLQRLHDLIEGAVFANVG